MKMQALLGPLIAAAALGCGAATAGTLIVSGDMTPVFSLSNSAPGAAGEGNGQFFRNILGGGDGVAILSTTHSTLAVSNLSNFYGAQPGVASVVVDATVGATLLAGAELLLLPSPSRTLTSQENGLVSSFLQAGGTVMMMGEAENIAFGIATNAVLGATLGAIGSSLSITNANLDIGTQPASGSQIAADALTASVNSFLYGFTSQVNGGTPLFFSINQTPFMAYEALAIPEPATLAMWLAGLAVLGSALRRSRAT